jgi:hypothetical protein
MKLPKTFPSVSKRCVAAVDFFGVENAAEIEYAFTLARVLQADE